ncbi:hypothetical protein EDB81DRAFT_784530 [Dactylonectria macrodidyma]|uniref:Secreted protein n=1 Tax=Dactylonectria macrodidyma TaxID=307937 RepID=A0A9P9JJP7_9HYPO|nr:hypothetical protein EDB81DRAFT_784530 [Dactylonectria macrodidyma]
MFTQLLLLLLFEARFRLRGSYPTHGTISHRHIVLAWTVTTTLSISRMKNIPQVAVCHISGRARQTGTLDCCYIATLGIGVLLPGSLGGLQVVRNTTGRLCLGA